jgi:hypothetical protein
MALSSEKAIPLGILARIANSRKLPGAQIAQQTSHTKVYIVLWLCLNFLAAAGPDLHRHFSRHLKQTAE